MAGKLDKLRVLIVEDDFLISEDFDETIRRAGGLVVGPATTAAAALELLERAERLDGALLDVNLGSANSGEVAHALAARGIPYIIVTGYGTEMIPPEMRDAPTLTKPFSRDKLLAEVGRCFGRRAGMAA